MTKFRNKYRIESSRLKDYDYSSDGAYFITICTKDREHFFGEIVDEKMQETEQSKICMACWLDLPNHYPNCILDEFIIMPNHVHGIVVIQNQNTNNNKTKQYSVSEIIRGFKTFTARKINYSRCTKGMPFWQSRFHDRIIRNEEELNRIREYIFNNVLNWESDRNNQKNSMGQSAPVETGLPVETGFKPVSTNNEKPVAIF